MKLLNYIKEVIYSLHTLTASGVLWIICSTEVLAILLQEQNNLYWMIMMSAGLVGILIVLAH
jgi:hypothetical protein